ncbi:DUF1292 domain-containing protein [Tissierella creatinophila]|uniref:DUF1292 domain-containing protein n=1 Tax=Tissierella creatinophila DSM 6911 TaxID=1123403 RepID=A0A1U7M9D3_TISCR|nr:DUF1292 domain-containing protein [Tissierella creatinophila]OLS03907.1 hypothetical protein TICRE_00340 [Tissierella creatinophila DSM 6911]
MQRHLFYDELGNGIEFLIKAKFTLDDIDYVAMLPADDIESDTYILRIDFDENGDEILVGIDDEELKEAEEVYEELLKENLQ